MSDLLRDYLTVAIFGMVGAGLVGALLGIGSLLRPTRPQDEKYISYESGVDPVGEGWAQTNVRYFVYAFLYVIFAVDAVFLFPWALRLEYFGVFGLVEMAVFVFILLLGLIYAWRKGVLRWV